MTAQNMQHETLSEQQKEYVLSKITDYWYMIDRSSDRDVIKFNLGRLDAVRMMLELNGYTYIANPDTGKREIITWEEYEQMQRT